MTAEMNLDAALLALHNAGEAEVTAGQVARLMWPWTYRRTRHGWQQMGAPTAARMMAAHPAVVRDGRLWIIVPERLEDAMSDRDKPPVPRFPV